jgi:hypothetical protein
MNRDIESQQELIEGQDGRRDVLRWVPVIGLCVSVYSAVFATAVLFPWHTRLSREFHVLMQTCQK